MDTSRAGRRDHELRAAADHGRRRWPSGECARPAISAVPASVRFVGWIRLTAVVGGNEVVNPCVVTEVSVRRNGGWTLGSLSFPRLLTPP